MHEAWLDIYQNGNLKICYFDLGKGSADSLGELIEFDSHQYFLDVKNAFSYKDLYKQVSTITVFVAIEIVR